MWAARGSEAAGAGRGAFAGFAQETDLWLPAPREPMLCVPLPFYDKIAVADVQLFGLLAQMAQFRMGSPESVVTQWPVIKLPVSKRFSRKTEVISQENHYFQRVA